MTNPFYSPSGNPGTSTPGLSALIRGEFAAVGVGFDLVPQIVTTGGFTTTFNQIGNYTYTLPGVSGTTLATTADVATEATARTVADAAEATARAAETTRAIAAEGTNAAAIAAEATSRSNADAAEVTARNAAIAVETAARVSADAAEVIARDAAIAAEASARIASLAGQLSGLGLTGFSTTQIGIGSGSCAASPATGTIVLTGAMIKSISGAWAAGSGANGMGPGLTATLNTWYHVYAAIIGGAADVFFDTTSPPTHTPAATAAYRRIGSFKLDGSTQVVPFAQNGDRFDLLVPGLEYSGTPGVTTAVTVTLAAVPPGGVEALLTGTLADAAALTGCYVSSLAQTDIVASASPTALSGVAGNACGWYARVFTNASAQIRRRVTTATATMNILTIGWIDQRGRG